MAPPIASSRGYSFIELIFLVALSATLTAITVPQVLASVDDLRAAGAARYLSSRLHRARMEAVARSVEVALRFTQTASGYTFAVYVDGNRNGVLANDIARGIDRPLGAPERLPDNFQGIDIGVLPGLPAVDPASEAPGTDPLKLGSSNEVSFSPLGTSSSGSVYIRGRGRSQYVVRIYGETGKARVLKFAPQLARWLPL